MGPGPSDISDRVLQAMARPTIGHLDPKFVEMMDDLKQSATSALRERGQNVLLLGQQLKKNLNIEKNGFYCATEAEVMT